MQDFMSPDESLRCAEHAAKETVIQYLTIALMDATFGCPPEYVMGMISRAHEAAEEWRARRNDRACEADETK